MVFDFDNLPDRRNSDSFKWNFCAEICLQRGVVICSDEIHSELTFSGHRHVPIAALDPQVAGNTITLVAPTMAYNLAGLQCSIAIIQNPERRRLYLKAKQGLVSWLN